MSKEIYRGSSERRLQLQSKKLHLEKMIRNTIDPMAVSKLRADYREVMNELDMYYTDELEGKGHE